MGERESLASDDTAGDTTLWVGTGNGAPMLHADRDCMTLQRSTPRRASAGERQTLDRCSHCEGRVSPEGRGAKRECLKCGKEFHHLPLHMAQCDGGDDDG